MTAASNTACYTVRLGHGEEMPEKIVKGSKSLSVKPKARPMSDGSSLITLACGATATIRMVPSQYGKGHEYTIDDEFYCGEQRRFSTFENALRHAGRRSRLKRAPLEGSPEKWFALACAVDRDIDAACKTLRELLRERTGRDWSVTRSRGTAYGWLRIHSPPKRRGAFDYLSVEDEILLSAALGCSRGVGAQGESIRTERGVRGSYVFAIAGVETPESWKVSEKGWD